MALERTRWEQIKTLKVVPRLVHLSYQVEVVTAEDGTRQVIRHGGTLDIGRNKRKRAHRASKTSRKHWWKVP